MMMQGLIVPVGCNVQLIEAVWRTADTVMHYCRHGGVQLLGYFALHHLTSSVNSERFLYVLKRDCSLIITQGECTSLSQMSRIKYNICHFPLVCSAKIPTVDYTTMPLHGRPCRPGFAAARGVVFPCAAEVPCSICFASPT